MSNCIPQYDVGSIRHWWGAIKSILRYLLLVPKSYVYFFKLLIWQARSDGTRGISRFLDMHKISSCTSLVFFRREKGDMKLNQADQEITPLKLWFGTTPTWRKRINPKKPLATWGWFELVMKNTGLILTACCRRKSSRCLLSGNLVE